MPEDFITIRTCSTAIEAEVFKSFLKANNIPCIIDEGIARANPLLTVAVGWIKIKVPKSQGENAKKLLETFGD